jgi:hypothetical protein
MAINFLRSGCTSVELMHISPMYTSRFDSEYLKKLQGAITQVQVEGKELKMEEKFPFLILTTT